MSTRNYVGDIKWRDDKFAEKLNALRNYFGLTNDREVMRFALTFTYRKFINEGVEKE